MPVDSPWTQSTMRTQYTELVVVEKGVELVAEEMVAEKEGKLVVEVKWAHFGDQHFQLIGFGEFLRQHCDEPEYLATVSRWFAENHGSPVHTEMAKFLSNFVQVFPGEFSGNKKCSQPFFLHKATKSAMW